MAQTGYTPIQLYYSTTGSTAPIAGNLANGELAINITDGKLFYKDNGGAVQVIGWKTVPATAGGTGQTGYTAGDLLYASSTTALSKLGIGTSNQILTSSGTAPQWSSALTVTGLTNSGSLTFTGTANRITGDMSNATAANRVLIQTSTVNSQTATGIMPNGTGTQAQWAVYNSSDPANSSQGRILITASLLSFQNLASGTGTSLPMAFFTGGSERVRIEAGGNVGVGTTTPNASAILDVQSTTKGVRFPNMTTVEKNAIGTPAAGLVVFDTTLAKLCVYSGAAWQTITSI